MKCNSHNKVDNKHTKKLANKDRSRVDWLRAGDRNTGFFHAQSTARRTRNRISALEDANGVLCETKEAIHAVVQQFYTNLYSAQEELVVDEVLHHVPVKVTEQMNDRLMRPFSAEEIDKALFAMAPLKAPGEDGFNAGFYQRHWNLIREDVTRAVLNFLNGGHMPEVVNKTVIVLIPKVKNPRNITQYRPISLCNVIYKICSKVLANRLREILDEIISEEQSAFVPGRLITDNVIMAYECIHAMRRKKGKQGWCAVKIDMMKAYDHVEWEYLQGVMLQLGFSEDWVSLVMKCVNSVSFQVKVNGELLPSFKPSRGFRQGDPISPYLFLLCGEGLSCMLKNYDGGWIDRGIRAGLRSPWVSHLLFADDCLVFMKADSRSATRLNEILQAYSHGSGQSANKQKSSVFFSPNCGASTRRVVQNILQIQREAMTEKYLGLPTAAGRITERILNTLWSQLDRSRQVHRRPPRRASAHMLPRRVPVVEGSAPRRPRGLHSVPFTHHPCYNNAMASWEHNTMPLLAPAIHRRLMRRHHHLQPLDTPRRRLGAVLRRLQRWVARRRRLRFGYPAGERPDVTGGGMLAAAPAQHGGPAPARARLG